MRLGLAAFAALALSSAHAQTIVVSSQSWEALSSEERAAIQSRYVVDTRDGSSYGEIVDAQGIDLSTPGTSSGAALGAAIGNAAYIDRAFKPDNNFSAKTQLAAILLGAVVGSALDKPAQAQYKFRYAVRMQSGDIEYRDVLQSDPFRHPPGVCLDLTSVEKVPQSLCAAGPVSLRARYLKDATTRPPAPPAPPSKTEATSGDTLQDNLIIQCKPANLAAVATTREKCLLINGEVL